jgi:hypothetical protein
MGLIQPRLVWILKLYGVFRSPPLACLGSVPIGRDLLLRFSVNIINPRVVAGGHLDPDLF